MLDTVKILISMSHKFSPILISYVPNLSHIFQRCSSCSGLIYDEKAKLNTLIL